MLDVQYPHGLSNPGVRNSSRSICTRSRSSCAVRETVRRSGWATGDTSPLHSAENEGKRDEIGDTGKTGSRDGGGLGIDPRFRRMRHGRVGEEDSEEVAEDVCPWRAVVAAAVVNGGLTYTSDMAEEDESLLGR
jgi:hypothetical protein